MDTKLASDLVGPRVVVQICVLACLLLTQVEDSTRYLFIAGLSAVMFLEFDVDSSSDVSSLVELARFEETSSSHVAFLALKFCSLFAEVDDTTKYRPKVGVGATKPQPPSLYH